MPTPPPALAALLWRAASLAGRRLASSAGATTSSSSNSAAAVAAFTRRPAVSASNASHLTRGVSTSGRVAASTTDGGDKDGGDGTPTPPPGDGTLWRSWIDNQLNELDRGAPPAGTPPPPPPPEDADASGPTAAAKQEGEEAAGTPIALSFRPPGARVTVSQPPPTALPSPVVGYAELGVPLDDAVADALVGGPAAAAAAAPYVPPPPPPPFCEGSGGGGNAPFPPPPRSPSDFLPPVGRLHPNRLFYPGMTYSPGDLVADEGGEGGASGAGPQAIPGFTGSTAAALAMRPPVTGVPPRGELRAAAPDFRNAPLLASLLSATGKLPPRRRTRLAAKDHRTLARSIKLARRLALLEPLGRGTVAGGPAARRRPPGPRREGGGGSAGGPGGGPQPPRQPYQRRAGGGSGGGGDGWAAEAVL